MLPSTVMAIFALIAAFGALTVGSFETATVFFSIALGCSLATMFCKYFLMM